MPKQKITKELPKRFPKLEDCSRKNGEEITKFADLETDISYHMFDIRTIPTKKGDAYIAEFETEEEERYTVWMPDSLVKKFKALKVKECYVFNKGKKENGSKSYFDTTLFKMDW